MKHRNGDGTEMGSERELEIMRGNGKGIFIIVRMICHREIRGNDNEGDAERLREIIRLAATIIDHSESYRDMGYVKK